MPAFSSCMPNCSIQPSTFSIFSHLPGMLTFITLSLSHVKTHKILSTLQHHRSSRPCRGACCFRSGAFTSLSIRHLASRVFKLNFYMRGFERDFLSQLSIQIRQILERISSSNLNSLSSQGKLCHNNSFF